jgi:ABC-type multidrug transport system ATPase subunit
MQVRLAFSIAIKARSDILLIDEVLAVGDANFQRKCFDYFQSIKGEKTVILVSHDMKSIERFCDNVLVLDRGKQLAVGEAQEMVFKYSTMMANESKQYKTTAKKKGVHIGNQKATVSEVALIKNNKRVSGIAEGQPLKIRLTIKSKKIVDEPIVHVSIFNADDNKKLLSANTEQQNIKIAQINKNGQIEITWPQNPLAAGEYRVNAGIFNDDMKTPIDHYRDALTFNVTGENWGNYQLSLPAEWEINA